MCVAIETKSIFFFFIFDTCYKVFCFSYLNTPVQCFRTPEFKYYIVGYCSSRKPFKFKFIISRRALAREGDYEMMPVCACMHACVR